MRIAVLCATQRGFRFINKLFNIKDKIEIIVFSFREEPWEPKFFDNIRNLTISKGGKFFEAKNIGSPRWTEFWRVNNVDLMFAVNWRYMIPPVAYRRPRLGTYVFHDSLLPKYRGFSPTVWSIINGEDHTGVTLFKIAEDVDSGDIIDQKRIDISEGETIMDVFERVTETYLELLERNIIQLTEGKALGFTQDHSLATYTCKRLPADNEIDWAWSSGRIYNLVRAVTNPYTGAFTFLSGRKITIWSAQQLRDYHNYIARIPGRIAEIHAGKGSVVLTGDGALLLKKVQLEGADVVCATDILNSLSLTLGP